MTQAPAVEEPLDLDQRTRDFFAAHGRLDPAALGPFLSQDLVVEYVGLETLDRAGLDAMLRAMHRNLGPLGIARLDFRLHSVILRRNVAVAEWVCHAERPNRSATETAGVHLLVWDREGLLTRATVYTDPEPLRHLSVGRHLAGGVAQTAI